MVRSKEEAPRAAATARRAGFVASRKPTRFNSAELDCHQPAIHGPRRSRVHAEGPAGSFIAIGQVAKALSALVAAGTRVLHSPVKLEPVP
jgi:hypothetical protein